MSFTAQEPNRTYDDLRVGGQRREIRGLLLRLLAKAGPHHLGPMSGAVRDDRPPLNRYWLGMEARGRPKCAL